MNKIITSILFNQSKDTIEELVGSSLLSEQELSYLSFIKDTLDNLGTFPTPSLIVSEFPELHLTEPFDQDTLNQYVSNFLRKRQNLRISQNLMKLATKVSQEGLSNSDLDPFLSHSNHKESSISSAEDYLSYYKSGENQPRGIVTNIKLLDDLIGNISYGDTCVIYGYTSHGKSLLGDNIVYHNAMVNRYNGCIISLEVPKEQVLNNLLVRHSISQEFSEYNPLDYKRLKNRELNEQEQDFLFNVLLPDFFDYSKHGMIKILDLTDFASTFSQFEVKKKLYEVDDECMEKTGYHLDVVDLDHVNLLKYVIPSSKQKSEFAVCNEFVKFFHDLAIDFRINPDGSHQKLISILLAQAGRTGYKKAAKNKGRYDLTAIAEINELERSAQIIIPVFMSDEMKLAKEASVQLLKNREGITEEDPQIIYSEPAVHAIGDVMGNFNESLSLSELEDAFGTGMGSIADLF